MNCDSLPVGFGTLVIARLPCAIDTNTPLVDASPHGCGHASPALIRARGLLLPHAGPKIRVEAPVREELRRARLRIAWGKRQERWMARVLLWHKDSRQMTILWMRERLPKSFAKIELLPALLLRPQQFFAQRLLSLKNSAQRFHRRVHPDIIGFGQSDIMR